MWTPLPSRALIRISGDDKISFLQGLVTNDITKLSKEHPLFACMLTPQGKFLYDFILSIDGDDILLECESTLREEILKKFSLYKLRSHVTLTPCDLIVHALWDEPAPEGAFADPRLPALGYRYYGESESGNIDESAYRIHRYTLGVPEGQNELPPSKAILLENNMDDLHAISWDKGCYMGQELTARTKYRGLVRKKLFPIQGDSLEKGADIFQGDQDIGTIMAYEKGVGLALIRLEALENPEPLNSNSNLVQVQRPDWMTLDEPS